MAKVSKGDEKKDSLDFEEKNIENEKDEKKDESETIQNQEKKGKEKFGDNDEKKEKPITIEKYLSDKDDYIDIVKTMLKSLYGGKLLSRQEWEKLIKKETTRRMS